jgi:hypothetical protein
MRRIALTLVGAAAFVAAGCGSESSMMTDPTGPGGAPVASSTFMALSPGGGSVGVPMGTPLEFHWGTAMGAGMEQFVDLHMGDLAGPIVPMSCAWSGTRRPSFARSSSPLQPGTHTWSTWEGAWST